MKYDKNIMKMYAVTDSEISKKHSSLEQAVEKSIKGGVTCVQLREKDKETLIKTAPKIRELCNKFRVPFIVNDDVEVAINVNADGVHVGQSDMEAGKVRKLIGNKMILGVSVVNLQQAVKAEKDGADYLGVGAVFPTATKTDADFVSYDTLKEICNGVGIPVVAIGGINMNNIISLRDSGISGVALVSAIFGADDIEKNCKELRERIEEVICYAD